MEALLRSQEQTHDMAISRKQKLVVSIDWAKRSARWTCTAWRLSLQGMQYA